MNKNLSLEKFIDKYCSKKEDLNNNNNSDNFIIKKIISPFKIITYDNDLNIIKYNYSNYLTFAINKISFKVVTISSLKDQINITDISKIIIKGGKEDKTILITLKNNNTIKIMSTLSIPSFDNISIIKALDNIAYNCNIDVILPSNNYKDDLILFIGDYTNHIKDQLSILNHTNKENILNNILKDLISIYRNF